MTKATLNRSAMLAALFVMIGAFATARASEPTAGASTITITGDQATRFVPIGVGKTVIVDMPRDVKDVLVADPRYANAIVRTARRAYLIGVAVGQTNIFFFD